MWRAQNFGFKSLKKFVSWLVFGEFQLTQISLNFQTSYWNLTLKWLGRGRGGVNLTIFRHFPATTKLMKSPYNKWCQHFSTFNLRSTPADKTTLKNPSLIRVKNERSGNITLWLFYYFYFERNYDVQRVHAFCGTKI